jgi:hypothetical protein
MIPRRVRQRLHERYLLSAVDGVIEANGHLHLWTHLYNISNEHQFGPVQSCLEYVADERDRGEIVVRRMCDLP